MILNPPDIVLLRGAPGIGKSTVAKYLAKTWRYGATLEVDQFRSAWNDVDWSDRRLHHHSLQAALSAALELRMRGAIPVLLIDCFNSSHLDQVEEFTEKYQLKSKLVTLRATAQEHEQRLRSRTGKSVNISLAIAMNRNLSSAHSEEIILDTSRETVEMTAERILATINSDRPKEEDRKVCVIIATKDRHKLLEQRSLPSLVKQTRAPEQIIIASDRRTDTETLLSLGRKHFPAHDLIVLPNSRQSGLGGAINTALHHLKDKSFQGVIALLDDDDEWHPYHLDWNLRALSSQRGNVCVSGLAMFKNNQLEHRPLCSPLSARDFLIGNPGWQGANTFIEFQHFLDCGAFSEDLPSLNDRDLAVRVLRHQATRLVLVPRWTAIWHLGTENQLSAPCSENKILGLKKFWEMYSPEMSKVEKTKYEERAIQLFNITPTQYQVESFE